MQLLGQMALAHLQHGLQLGIFGRSETVRRAKGPLFGAKQRPQRTKLLQQMAGEIDRTQATDPGAQEDRQQLGVGQAARPLTQQLLARAFIFRPLLDAHLSLPHAY